jgi:hypothetical protein
MVKLFYSSSRVIFPFLITPAVKERKNLIIFELLYLYVSVSVCQGKREQELSSCTHHKITEHSQLMNTTVVHCPQCQSPYILAPACCSRQVATVCTCKAWYGGVETETVYFVFAVRRRWHQHYQK